MVLKYYDGCSIFGNVLSYTDRVQTYLARQYKSSAMTELMDGLNY